MIGKELRIVYMGTPEFAVEPLSQLHTLGYNIVSVITMPDKPSGRGMKLTFSPVKQYAVDNNLPLLQPLSLKDPEFLNALKSLEVDLGVVVAFKMLPESVWNMPRLGTFNLHTSILPDYRGAAPINWAVINGDSYSGVTTFMLDHQIDTGAVIESRRTDITQEDTAGTLHDKLMYLGAGLVVDTVENIANGNTQATAQSTITGTRMRPAPKIFKEDCQIEWEVNVESIHNKVRGLSPYPAAWCDLHEANFKLFTTKPEHCVHTHEYGTVISDGKSFIKVACEGGFLHIKELQMAGKKRMDTESLLRGCRIFDNDILVSDKK